MREGARPHAVPHHHPPSTATSRCPSTPQTHDMADMEVDTPVDTEPKGKGKVADDSKGGKKRFEVKKVRMLTGPVCGTSDGVSGS